MKYSHHIKYAKSIGEVTGHLHKMEEMEEQSSFLKIFGVLKIFTLIFLQKFTRPKNTQTPYLDKSMAYSFGLNKTGPGGWFAGFDNIKSQTTGIPLSNTWSVEIHQNLTEIRVQLKRNNDIVFERHFTENGFQTLHNTGNFFWPNIDGHLALLVSPMNRLDRQQTHESLCLELGIPRKERIQTRGK